MLLGSIGLRARTCSCRANLAYFLMLLLCGVNIPLDALPGWMRADRTAACRSRTGSQPPARSRPGASLGSVSGLVWTEAGVGAAYAVLAFVLVRWFEYEGRRRASLETY